MNIKEYARVINELASLHPKAEVIYSSDDEGNDYKHVFFHPSAGKFNEKEREFKSFGDPDDIVKSTEVNAVCVN